MSTDLDAVYSDLMNDLALGVTDRKHPFHQPVLATITPTGEADARIVVLRGFDPVTRTLRCHTDLRSPKVEHLRAAPSAAWVVYDPERRVQIRLRGSTVVRSGLDDALVRAAWEQTNAWSRRCYLAPAAPSSLSTVPTGNLPPGLEHVEPTIEVSEAGAVNFAVVETTFRTIDWLSLKYDGHRRMIVEWSDAGDRRMSWVEP